jgi:hypothetical protein
MIYTAIEILNLAGVKDPEKKIGKVSTSISGINIRKPDQLINTQLGKTAEVIVGVEKFVAKFDGKEGLTEGAKKVKVGLGRKATEAAADLKKSKIE